MRVKVRSGRLDPDAFGISLDDLAMDCVADFFERDAAGHFVEIASYYKYRDFSLCSQEELLGATRRLVFSKVNEGLFRLYRDNDRSLSNVIRNLKGALRSSKKLIAATRTNEWWIQIRDLPSTSEGLPILPPELVESRLIAETSHPLHLRDLLDAFAETLLHQDVYQKQYPMVGFAVIVRNLLFHSYLSAEEQNDEATHFTSDEVKEFARSSIARTKVSMRPSYVANGKLSERTYNIYFDCIGDILEAEYVRHDGINLTYYEILRNRLGSLSEPLYKERLRVYLEYLARLTRKDFLGSIKSELRSAT